MACACLADVVAKLCEAVPEPPAPPSPVKLSLEMAETPGREARSLRAKRRRPSPRALPPAVLREDPASRPFFCGRWVCSRNDYEGEVRLSALGICVAQLRRWVFAS